ncbi:hypothetical protein [Rummeliibacillus sp. SL167]|uniref:hypothetical protein n=1 Tax=Rummeliibacillus sp. SL167 TaxID=2579792 RepID=UPI0011B49466|nr:hypothetical protein [Rummeliibacillus sp. SL167]
MVVCNLLCHNEIDYIYDPDSTLIDSNNDEKPLKAKVQVSDNLKGFIITDDYNNEESKEYVFKNIESVPIKAGIGLDKKGEIYGVSIIHNKAIDKVHIKYSYLGILFAKTVPFDK